MKFDYFAQCIGKPLVDIGHAADLIWVIIGDISAHLSADAAVFLNGKVVAETNDLYYDTDGKSVVYVPKTTQFDIKIAALRENLLKYRVTEISLTPETDLCIEFSDGLCITTFGNTPSDEEKWRFLKKGSKLVHMVAYKSGVKWE